MLERRIAFVSRQYTLLVLAAEVCIDLLISSVHECCVEGNFVTTLPV